MEQKIPLLVIVGPTASGKTKLSIELAKSYDGEIISADSMQIYKEMDIGTAKPDEAEREGIPHHLLDFLPPDRSFSVADYVTAARECIAQVAERGHLPILVGGTGLYVSSLLDGVDFSEATYDPALREKLRFQLEAEGKEALFERLQALDPALCEKLHPNNTGRVLRALEVCLTTGKPMSQVQKEAKKGEGRYRTCCLLLDFEDRAKLYARIDQRVDAMVEAGVLVEAKRFWREKLSPTALQAIGYKEFFPYFEGEATLPECIEKLKQDTRRYAKRQLTWFRRREDQHRLLVDTFESFPFLYKKAAEFLENDLGLC